MKSLFLVGCSKNKKKERCEARLLYNSERFKKARNIAEHYSDRWLIVSGKHVVVEPDEVINPYDEDLNKKGKRERDRWHEELANRIQNFVDKGDILVCIGDKNYFSRLENLVDKKVKIYNIYLNTLVKIGG